MTRAALITEFGSGAVFGEIAEVSMGDGESPVAMETATLNPVDLAIAGGKLFLLCGNAGYEIWDVSSYVRR